MEQGSILVIALCCLAPAALHLAAAPEPLAALLGFCGDVIADLSRAALDPSRGDG